MTNYCIYKTVPQDFLEIAALDREAWRNNNNSDFIPDGEHVWRIWCEHAVMYSAKFESKVIGAILAFKCENGIYFVHKIMVALQMRNQGIGTALFKHLIDHLDREKSASFLTVDPSNDNALALFSSWGYKVSEYVKGYYRSYEDRYVMIREPQ